MKHLLLLPSLGLALIQVITWFGVLPPQNVSLYLSIAGIAVFLIGLFSAQRFSIKEGNNLGERIVGNISLKNFFIGLVLIIYFVFNFIYSNSVGGSTKVENGKYFAMQQVTKRYYEISATEYMERQPHQIRAATGHPLIFGLLGFLMFSATRSSNKSLKQDK